MVTLKILRLSLSGGLFFIAATGLTASIFGIGPVDKVINLIAVFLGVIITLMVFYCGRKCGR